jgi:hypothetical protein
VPAWKVLFIVVLAGTCLAMAMGPVVVPLALTAEEHKWLWFAGLLLATTCRGTLFTLYLRWEDRTFKR